MKNKLLVILAAALILVSCAHPKSFINDKGQRFIAKPYGWADYDKEKIPGVVYEASIGNIVLSVLFSESLIVPIWLTGWDIMKPVDYIPVKNK